MDEGNNVAENGINGAINYAERNSLATIGTKTFITIDEDEDEDQSHHTQNRGICRFKNGKRKFSSTADYS